MSDSGIYTRRRLGLLQALAYAADEPLVAVIGSATGNDLIALAKGVRRPHPLRKGSAAGSVICFHGPRGVGAVRRVIAAYARSNVAGWRRRDPAIGVDKVVRFVGAADETRGPWEVEIARLQRATVLRFGLICHMGQCPLGEARLARRDLDLLVPMMNDRTSLVLCGLEKGAPRELLRGLLRDGGWTGVWRRSLGLAELGRMPFAA